MGQFLHISGSLLAQEEATQPEFYVRTVHLWSYIILLLIIIFALMQWAKSGLNERVFKKPITSCFEQLYLFIENMCVATIGPHGHKYVTMIMTLWMLIFAGNILALFAPFSPTASLSFNLGMALVCIVYVQSEGIRANGLIGHVRHFAGPKLAGIMAIVLTPIIFVIELVSELMKNLSLSLRLYGNIHGGHVAVEKMNGLLSAIYFPIGELLLPLKLLTCVVQALVFTLLTCVYLSLVTHHEGDDAHHAETADGAGLATAH